MSTLPDLLRRTIELRASDLHLTAGSPPQVRVDGDLQRLDMPELTPSDTKQYAYSVLTDAQKKRFEEALELDFSFGLRGLARFRCNLFNQRGAVAAVYRVITENIRGFKELALPEVVVTLADRPRGLVLVTGPTGSGKSTTLAAMIDKINRERKQHILTIEDPIEYIHPHKQCLVNQREVLSDTHGFAPALRAALREDPDVVYIGEMRDLETVESALRIAETGHLTFATLHTNSAAQTINRVIDVFPAHQQTQIRTQLSMVLEGIVCQSLAAEGRRPRPRRGGGGAHPDAGDPQPHPRRQGAPDLRADAGRAGEDRHPDAQSGPGEPLLRRGDHDRHRAPDLVDARRADGHDQPGRRGGPGSGDGASRRAGARPPRRGPRGAPVIAHHGGHSL